MPDWLYTLFGLVLIYSGYFSIKRKYSETIDGNINGGKAIAFGVIWIISGIILILAVVFDIAFIRGIFDAL